MELESTPAVLDEVWTYAWDNELNTIPARPITDRAISTWRQEDVNKMIVHYMQPHVPFIDRPDLGTYGDTQNILQSVINLPLIINNNV